MASATSFRPDCPMGSTWKQLSKNNSFSKCDSKVDDVVSHASPLTPPSISTRPFLAKPRIGAGFDTELNSTEVGSEVGVFKAAEMAANAKLTVRFHQRGPNILIDPFVEDRLRDPATTVGEALLVLGPYVLPGDGVDLFTVEGRKRSPHELLNCDKSTETLNYQVKAVDWARLYEVQKLLSKQFKRKEYAAVIGISVRLSCPSPNVQYATILIRLHKQAPEAGARIRQEFGDFYRASTFTVPLEFQDDEIPITL